VLGFAGARIGKGLLRGGQLVVVADIGADKGWSQHWRLLRIKRAEANRVDERARGIERAGALPVQMPLFAAQFL